MYKETTVLEELLEMYDTVASLVEVKESALAHVLGPTAYSAYRTVCEVFEKADRTKKSIEELIKKEVLELGHTVESEKFQFVYSDGRISWDTAGLNGYAVLHPEITTFRKEGKPYVSIKKKKGE